MTSQTKTVIKSYFETGDRPTQAQFADLIDSYVDTSAGVLYDPVIVNGSATNLELINPIFSGSLSFVSANLSRPVIVSASIIGGRIISATISALAAPLSLSDGGTNSRTAVSAFNEIKQVATSANSGVVELATETELRTGTDSSRVPTPESFLSALGYTARYISSAQTVTSGGLVTLVHGLPRVPQMVHWKLVFIGSAQGYNTGDILFNSPVTSTAISSNGFSIRYDNTNLYIRYGGAAAAVPVTSNSTGNTVAVTNTDINLIVEAWA